MIACDILIPFNYLKKAIQAYRESTVAFPLSLLIKLQAVVLGAVELFEYMLKAVDLPLFMVAGLEHIATQ
jgi:hypothetical protein